MESRRAESFSDGVFAVAITVLVFNLLPVARSGISFSDLAGGWPQYAGYAVSFLTIGIMWLNHHTMLSHVSRVDRVTLVLNMFLLMGIVAVPFPTALVADNLANGASSHGARVAAVTYGLLMVAIAVAYSGMWMYLAAHQDTLAAKPIRPPRQATLRFSAGSVGYVLGTCVAFASALAALAIYAVIAVYYLFEHLPEA
ncbi:MAG TPA: TMEM175 family protein, partial [Streptosporangiaceae bacterium]